MPTVDYEKLYNALIAEVIELSNDLRSMQLKASDREAGAYEDARDMTLTIIQRAVRKEPSQ